MKSGELKTEIRESIRELSRLEGWITGSLIKTTRDQGRGPKPFNYLSRSVKGKNKINKNRKEYYLESSLRIWIIVWAMSGSNWELLLFSSSSMIFFLLNRLRYGRSLAMAS